MRAFRASLFASAAAGAPPPPTFLIGVSLSGGGGPYNVSGATGNLYTSSGSFIGVSGSGGTPPYTFNPESLVIDGNNGTGTLSRILSGDGVHNTVRWSGMNIGDTILFHINVSAHDAGSPQQNDSATYPSSGVIAINRTS